MTDRTIRLCAAIVAAAGLALALGNACGSSSNAPIPCRVPADCNGGCCALEDPSAATGFCADASAGNACLCLSNADCTDSDGCCQPFLVGGVPGNAQVCATQVDDPGIFQCCTGGVTTCQGDLCCVHMSTGGEYCALPCSTEADCNGGACVGGSPIAFFGCGDGTYCGPGTGSSTSSSGSGAGGADAGTYPGNGCDHGTGGAGGAADGGGAGGAAPSGCRSSSECDGGCCVLGSACAATGTCAALDPDGGQACVCLSNADCPGSSGCCQPLLDDAGVAFPAQVCAVQAENPGAYQCCTGGVTNCQGDLCCVHMDTGGEYCALPCSTDADCHGGHCTAGSAVALFGCGAGLYCGP